MAMDRLPAAAMRVRHRRGLTSPSESRCTEPPLKRTATLLIGLLLAASASARDYVPRTGDIVFHTSTSSQSVAVQAATRSPYSHMGIVMLRDGRPYVLEAVQPVGYTPLQAWLDRGRQGRYVVKRPRAPLSAEAAAGLQQQAARYLGKPYDLTFEWSDERIYCSELVWKLYRSAAGIELAPLATLGSFDLDAAPVRVKLRERYGNQVPLHEPVISPAAIFASPLLETVDQR